MHTDNKHAVPQGCGEWAHRLMPLELEEALKMTSVQIPLHFTDDKTRPTNTIDFVRLNLLPIED